LAREIHRKKEIAFFSAMTWQIASNAIVSMAVVICSFKLQSHANG